MTPSQPPEDNRNRCLSCPGRSHSICDAIEDCDLAILARESSRMTISDGRSFVEEGAKALDFFVITSGRVKLFTLLSDGRRQITAFAESGDFLGLAASENYAFGAETLGVTTLCRFPYTSMQRLIDRFPMLGHRLRKEASRELALMQKRITLLGRKTARERLASFLLERARLTPLYSGISHTIFDLPMTRTDIADYLGLTIETVSRVFSAFRRENLIAVSAITHITLLKPEKILQISEGLG